MKFRWSVALTSDDGLMMAQCPACAAGAPGGILLRETLFHTGTRPLLRPGCGSDFDSLQHASRLPLMNSESSDAALLSWI